jgi:perosamine synthetase
MPSNLPLHQQFVKSFFKVPFLVPCWDAGEFKAIHTAIAEGCIVTGRNTERVEKELSRRLGTSYLTLTTSGRSAIKLALAGLGLRPGDEVILPTFGCSATVAPIVDLGCVPVFADVDVDLNLDPANVDRHITPKTKAIIIHHLSGVPADILGVLETVRARGIFVIDNAAQAFGLKIGDRQAGTLGDCGVYSFGFGKLLTAGAGGLLVTDSREVMERVSNIPKKAESPLSVVRRAYRTLFECRLRRMTLPFFKLGRFTAQTLRSRLNAGTNKKRSPIPLERMSNLDAGILIEQLEKTEEIIARRNDNAKHLERELGNLEGLEIQYQRGQERVFTKFLARVETRKMQSLSSHSPEAIDLADYLFKHRIEIEWSYRPLHLRDEFRAYWREALPVSERLWPHIVTLPVNPTLGIQEMDYIISAMKRYFEKRIL